MFNPIKYVALDTETTGLRPWKGHRAFAVSMCDENGDTWYCEWPVNPYTREVTPDPKDLEYISSFLSSERYEKVFHNAKFDVRMMQMFGVQTIGVVHDTHIAARVANNVEFTLGLKPLAQKYLSIPNGDEKDLKDEVRRYRRLAQSHNRAVIKAGEGTLIQLGGVVEEDYWLPKHYDKKSTGCQYYCEIDTVRTMALHLMYQEIFQKDPDLHHGYKEEMYDLWPVVNEMEQRGMRCDRVQVMKELEGAKATAQHHLNKMLSAVKELGLKPFPETNSKYGSDFNPGSTTQLRRVLYLPIGQGGLGLFTKRTSDSGEFSTDKNALRELMSEPFVRDLVAYRAAEQVISLFFDKWQDLLVTCPFSGEEILRPGLNQCGTVTFRFSSSDPNLQQVGNPKTAHNNVSSYQPRAPFGPRKEYYWYAGDYAQQELRLFADISQNPFLLQEIRAGRDPNSACANKAWGGRNNPAAIKAAALALDLGKELPTTPEVAKAWDSLGWTSADSKAYGSMGAPSQAIADQWLARFDYDIVLAEKSVGRSNSRGRAKNVVFAKVYGGGPSSVTELLYCSLAEAKAFMDDYDKVMPEVNVYMSEMIAKARRDGYIINPYGRKVRVEQDFCYRAVNYMIQSTAACQMKDSIVRCHRYLKETGLDAHVIMTIHDELLFEIRKTHAYKWILRGLVDIMQDNEGRISIPTPVELKRAKESWANKETVVL